MGLLFFFELLFGVLLELSLAVAHGFHHGRGSCIFLSLTERVIFGCIWILNMRVARRVVEMQLKRELLAINERLDFLDK